MATLSDLLARAAARTAATPSPSTKPKPKQSHPFRDGFEAPTEESPVIPQDWQTTSLVLCYDQWTCACGASGTSPEGLFLLQVHTRMANSIRLQPIRHESSLPDLQRRIKITERVVALCPGCASLNGFLTRYQPPPPPALRGKPSQEPSSFIAEWNKLRAPLPEEASDED